MLKIENVLPKCRLTESITHNSAKFRYGFSDLWRSGLGMWYDHV